MRTRSRRGFSLVELLMVVAILAIMAAISVPLIFQWLSGYRLRAGVQEIAGELQTARTQAIMKNVGRGVALYVVDSNTYRYVNLDLAASAVPAEAATAVGPLRNLPDNIFFEATPPAPTPALPGVATTGLRFSRLGAACGIDGACAAPVALCPEPECNDNTTTDFAPRDDPADGTVRFGLRDERTGLTSVVSIGTGGRIQSQ